MASTNKTANLDLNQWSLSDKPEMADFNADNTKIDTVVSAHLAENAANDVHGLKFKGVLAKLGANSSIPSGSNTIINWTDEVYDTNAFHSSSVNVSRITIPTGFSRVKIQASLLWNSASSGYRRAVILKNNAVADGCSQVEIPPGEGILGMLLSTPVLNVSQGDYFEIRVFQNSGNAINVLLDPRTWFALEVVE